MTPLERLRAHTSVHTVDADGALAFTKSSTGGVLIVLGDPSRPEVSDVAVVALELQGNYPQMHIALASPGDDPKMKTELGLTSLPALVFVKDGVVTRTLARMCSWASYDDAARSVASEELR